MKTASTEVTSIRRRNNVKKSTWRTHLYFVDFESRIHVEISTSNRCHNFHVDSIDVISTNFPCEISTSNRWRIDEDVSIGWSSSPRRFRSNILPYFFFSSNRRLRVVLDGTSSQEYPVNVGIPEGFILVSTLFPL